MAVADCFDILQVDPEEELQRRLDEELNAKIERYESEFSIFTGKKDKGWFDIE